MSEHTQLARLGFFDARVPRYTSYPTAPQFARLAEPGLALFQTATDLFAADGYDAIGIDRFALPTDSMAIAAKAGSLRRNFQGYTDDAAV